MKYRQHAHSLAALHRIRLVEDPSLRPEDAGADPKTRMVLCYPIIDETTYCVALHEMGHLAAPGGVVFDRTKPDPTMTEMRKSMLRTEEERAAWNWARDNALDWNEAMSKVEAWGRQTYGRDMYDKMCANIHTPGKPLKDLFKKK